MYNVVPANEELIKEFIRNIRDEDALETVRATGKPLTESILNSFYDSEGCYVARWNDRILCIFGWTVPSVLGDVASPWMLSTYEVENHWREFLRRSKVFVQELNNDYGLLVNFVDARYEKSIRWLRWLGFTIMPAEPYGECGNMFHPFIMRKQNGN